MLFKWDNGGYSCNCEDEMSKCRVILLNIVDAGCSWILPRQRPHSLGISKTPLLLPHQCLPVEELCGSSVSFWVFLPGQADLGFSVNTNRHPDCFGLNSGNLVWCCVLWYNSLFPKLFPGLKLMGKSLVSVMAARHWSWIFLSINPILDSIILLVKSPRDLSHASSLCTVHCRALASAWPNLIELVVDSYLGGCSLLNDCPPWGTRAQAWGSSPSGKHLAS